MPQFAYFIIYCTTLTVILIDLGFSTRSTNSLFYILKEQRFDVQRCDQMIISCESFHPKRSTKAHEAGAFHMHVKIHKAARRASNGSSSDIRR
jgi:hypothetical protein